MSENGETVLLFLIFKGKQVPFRFNTLTESTHNHETVSYVLRSDSLIACRDNKPRMNSKILLTGAVRSLSVCLILIISEEIYCFSMNDTGSILLLTLCKFYPPKTLKHKLYLRIHQVLPRL